ncbi:MAG: hypothetical protein M1334_02665 [Patescibacteria group bacterium]|nr:hypothetical protein [Patescibacteria group bacterium]
MKNKKWNIAAIQLQIRKKIAAIEERLKNLEDRLAETGKRPNKGGKIWKGWGNTKY